MKKLFTFAAALVMGLGMQAQIVTSTSRSIVKSETVKPAPEKIWMIRAGVNFAGFSGSDTKGMDKKTSYDVSFEFNKPISSVQGLYWGMEFGLGSRGYSIDEESLTAHNIRYSPFILGYKYNVTGDIALDAHIGAFVSADYTGKISWDDEDESIKMADWKDEAGLDWQRVDAGIRFGVGVWYKNFNLDFSWHRGFIKPFTFVYDYGYDEYEEYTAKANTSNFMIRLGIAF